MEAQQLPHLQKHSSLQNTFPYSSHFHNNDHLLILLSVFLNNKAQVKILIYHYVKDKKK